MAELNNEQINQLWYLIKVTYDIPEMKSLCGHLDVRWEAINAEPTQERFAQELVAYFKRRGDLQRLIEQVAHDRPIMFQRSGLAELINSYSPHVKHPYNDPYEEYPDTSTSSGDLSEIYAGVIFVVITILVAGCWFLYSSTQRQRELRDAEAFATGYFNLLDNYDCQDAWERLSGDYRVNKHSTGLTPYCEYWNSFRKVEILKLEVLDETDTTASVEVVLALTNSDNTVVNQSIVYTLTRLAGTDPWIIAGSSP
jgi:hypothetical protein